MAVLDEDGEGSESERLRLKAILYIRRGVDLAISPMIWRTLVCWMFKVDDGHIFNFGLLGERECTPSLFTRQRPRMIDALIEAGNPWRASTGVRNLLIFGLEHEYCRVNLPYLFAY